MHKSEGGRFVLKNAWEKKYQPEEDVGDNKVLKLIFKRYFILDPSWQRNLKCLGIVGTFPEVIQS